MCKFPMCENAGAPQVLGAKQIAASNLFSASSFTIRSVRTGCWGRMGPPEDQPFDVVKVERLCQRHVRQIPQA